MKRLSNISSFAAIGLVLGLAVGHVSPAKAWTEMSDQQMDQVTAGSAAVSEDGSLFRVGFDKVTGMGREISGDASFTVLNTGHTLNYGTLSLTDNAQSNLSALVNINAVNAPVNVLLNLNITIDSEVGSLNQINVNTPIGLPAAFR